jgi:hypothetical protein
VFHEVIPVVRDELALMFKARWRASSLEHYEPMARALAVTGIVHRLISGSAEIERICLDGAVKFARRAGLDRLAERFFRGLAPGQ